MTTIAVTGATGQLGRLTIAALKRRAPEARLIALVRDPAKAADLGVEVREFDYTTPATLASGLEGVEVLAVISSNDFNDRPGQHRNVFEAAKAAGVGRVLYTSLLRADTSPALLAADHKASEAVLKASGLTYTVLRNGWYTENYTGSLGGALQAGAIVGAAPKARISSAPRADYAEALAVVASTPGHEGKVYELAGSTAFSLEEFAAEVSRQTGREIPYAAMPEGEYAALLVSFGLPEGFATVLADADATSASADTLFDDSRTLERLIGRPTVSFAETVAEALKG